MLYYKSRERKGDEKRQAVKHEFKRFRDDIERPYKSIIDSIGSSSCANRRERFKSKRARLAFLLGGNIMKTYYHVDMECSIHSTQFRANTTDNPSFQWLNIDSFEQACKVISVNQQCEQVRQMLREAECTAEFELGWTQQESRS